MKASKLVVTALVLPIIASSLIAPAYAADKDQSATNANVKKAHEQKDAYKKAHSVAKDKLPQDPRGPLPANPEEIDAWLAANPDPLLDTVGTEAVTVEMKSLPTDYLDSGDIILGATPIFGKSSVPYGYFRHGSTYSRFTGGFISAMPEYGVYHESVYFWSTEYGDVSLNWVPNTTWEQRDNLVMDIQMQVGEPYSFTTTKSDLNSWYCTKLPWDGYNYYTGIDIDFDGGYYVFPDDIFQDSDVSQYWRG